MNIHDTIRKYCFGEYKFPSRIEEGYFLKEMYNFLNLKETSNSGKLSEWYIEHILKENGIKYLPQPCIRYAGIRYIKPDFYLPEKDIFIEVKSRTFNTSGTASEKLDNVPRKYSKLQLNNNYKNSKILIVCSAGELLRESTLELIECNTESLVYTRDFIELCKKHNILGFTSIVDFLKFVN